MSSKEIKNMKSATLLRNLINTSIKLGTINKALEKKNINEFVSISKELKSLENETLKRLRNGNMLKNIKKDFWSDEWVRGLTPVERLVAISLFANPSKTVSTELLASQTGLEERMVETILERFKKAGKI